MNTLSSAQVRRLHGAVLGAVADAVAGGGVHTLELLPFRKAGARCPRCGAAMQRATVGSRTTWWCSREQR